MLSYITTVLFFVSGCLCIPKHVVFDSCKDIETQPDFDVKRYSGGWYDIQKTFFPGQMDKTCPKATYTLQPDGKVHVLNEDLTADGKRENTTGVAYYKDANDRSKLTVQLGDSPPANYWIVETDYETYSLVYSCNIIGSSTATIFWILGREPTLDESIKAKLKQDLTNKGLTWDKFFDTVEENCPW